MGYKALWVLPQDKLLRIQESLFKWLGKKSATKREILSLVGLLQHATSIVRCGCNFVAQMYATADKVKELHFFIRLNKKFQSDIACWHTFIQCWNGLSMLHRFQPPPTDLLFIQVLPDPGVARPPWMDNGCSGNGLESGLHRISWLKNLYS